MDSNTKGDAPVSSAPPSEDRASGLKRASLRLLVASSAGVITYFALFSFPAPVRALGAWDVAAFTLLSLAWSFIWRATPVDCARRAARQDPGRNVVTAIVLRLSTLVIVVGILGDYAHVGLAKGRDGLYPLFVGLTSFPSGRSSSCHTSTMASANCLMSRM